MAILVRTRNDVKENSIELEEFMKLVQGVKNNSPHVFDEMLPAKDMGGVAQKRAFRQAFGRDRGNQLRLAGGGMINIGPIVTDIMFEFSIKLARSLYYRHTKELFEGVIFVKIYNLFQVLDPEDLIAKLVSVTPYVGDVKRCGKLLIDQFTYRFNIADDKSIFFSVIQFSEQLMLHVVAMNWEVAARFEQDRSADEIAVFGRKKVVRFI